MLVLTRKFGQRILIGKDIVIEVRGVEPGRARIGVTAPRGTEIVREEIAAKKQQVAK
jgi:carbon storage regulator